MGKYVSLWVNLVTAFCLWWIGVVGGAFLCILPLLIGQSLIPYLYKKAHWGDFLLIIIMMIFCYMYRERSRLWRIGLYIGLFLLAVPFFWIFHAQIMWLIKYINTSKFLQYTIMIAMLPVAIYIFRLTSWFAMFAGLRIGTIGFNPKKISYEDERRFDEYTNEFLSKYTFDIISWTPFFWRPKTIEELAKDEIAREKHAEMQANLEREYAQKEQDLKDAVAAKVRELKEKEPTLKK